MQNYYLAVDIGASSGRHILGHLESGKMWLEEIYRFENAMKNRDGRLLWDVEYLFAEIVNGMKKCAGCGKIPVSMSIDTWAVDYVLLDENDKILGDTYGYRDSRTTGMDKRVYEIIPEKELYTVEKSAEILVKTLSMKPDKLQTITPDDFRNLAKYIKSIIRH